MGVKRGYIFIFVTTYLRNATMVSRGSHLHDLGERELKDTNARKDDGASKVDILNVLEGGHPRFSRWQSLRLSQAIL